ncbi:NAD(P)H-hydrate dehydratase [Phormidium sp. LEGE 05292]|uniref:NAD(P)H-hydrate dehydratase n=1 Tax=[Phormidium] sp. LEGE 05292 TaxID=767427 RepID=UPI00188252DF|nr:NAD(P)H-hydrate dehydratase [Phormidium sp. LEGE 05292]MBE9225278.1 NAD(P)H-hydrate dehydratase [Phormidium sp. LEGE 05292]
MNRREKIQQIAVTADQMREIEGRIFAAGMPVAALMEKVAGSISQRIQSLFPLYLKPTPSPSPYNGEGRRDFPEFSVRIGVLVGPGHNGGDALVVARELHFRGYQVKIYRPFSKLKDLTAQHDLYAQSLGICYVENIAGLQDCDLIIDGLFGFGLEREIKDNLAEDINQLNQWSKPVVSIDLPSGLHTDTGEVLGTAIKATHTLCLGLWKLGLLQDQALEYVGKADLIDFDIPWADVMAILGETPQIQRVTTGFIKQHLPLPRPAVTHKYKQGHLLLICGSRRYAGGAILTGLGARGSGVGMLSIAVPEYLKPLLVSHLPEALIIGCEETENGAISSLPETVDLGGYDAIACGPGITTEATTIVEGVLANNKPVILDADGLNILAQLGTISTLKKRQEITVLTPHTGEFKRLFPEIENGQQNRFEAVKKAAELTKAIVLLKGARTAIGNGSGQVWIIPESTPALARGGSGDVLTGLIGGLLAQGVAANINSLTERVVTAAWWHAQAGILAAKERTELGVDAFTLTQFLNAVLSNHL